MSYLLVLKKLNIVIRYNLRKIEEHSPDPLGTFGNMNNNGNVFNETKHHCGRM